MHALIVSVDDHFAYWGAVCLDVAGLDVSVMAARAWGVTRLSNRPKSYASCGIAPLRRADPAFLDGLDEYCAAHRIDWIVPADLPATLMVAKGRDRLRSARLFPVAEPSLIEMWNDKATFGALLLRLGLPTPPFWLLSSPTELPPPSLPFPLMVKPPRGEGGKGVQRFDRRTDLLDALPGLGARLGWPLLLQEYIPGTDIDLSALADRGRIAAWTIQRRAPGGIDLLEFVEHPRVLEIGSELIRRTGFHGLVHFDLRLDERTGEPMLIEANPRFWSSIRHSMWMGVNFPALGLELAAGGDPLRRFQPAVGLCRDPGLSIKSTVRALVRGRWGPDGLSEGSAVGWRSHVRDPLPELWRRLHGLIHHRRQSVL